MSENIINSNTNEYRLTVDFRKATRWHERLWFVIRFIVVGKADLVTWRSGQK